MAQWNKNTVPKCEDKTCSDEVLVTVEKDCIGTYRRVLKAVYIPYHHCTLEDMGWNMYDGVPDDLEYIDEEDTWWIPQGWYEVCDYFEDYSYSTIADKVIAWMKLPKAFEPKLKEFYNKELDDFIHECDKLCGYYKGENKIITREDMLKIAERLKH